MLPSPNTDPLLGIKYEVKPCAGALAIEVAAVLYILLHNAFHNVNFPLSILKLLFFIVKAVEVAKMVTDTIPNYHQTDELPTKILAWAFTVILFVVSSIINKMFLPLLLLLQIELSTST